jgi:hypothetical protein
MQWFLFLPPALEKLYHFAARSIFSYGPENKYLLFPLALLTSNGEAL